jgi:nucleoredoxin
MNRLITAISLATILASISIEARTWTSKTGTTIEAKFIKEKHNLVYLKTADGAVKTIKKSNLAEADQKLATRLANPFAAKKAAEAARPKAPEAIYDLFGTKLFTARKKKVSVDTLAGKTIGIYFSAHWCPPCRIFTPQLVEFHKEMTRQGNPFEIVFVSSDHDKSSMYSYMLEMDMPWLALEFGDDHKSALKSKYNVNGIPKLVIIDADGKLITENGRGNVSRMGADAYKQWQ